MIDQIVWLLGRPTSVSSIQHNVATPELPTYADNTLASFEFASAIASLEIAAMEPPPTARRFEVYGTGGSAILEPFDPSRSIRLTLRAASAEYPAGETVIPLPPVSRQEFYERELAAFVRVVRGEQVADRPAAHELLVQETLLRATGALA
jgi:predicted dehydrogenase